MMRQNKASLFWIPAYAGMTVERAANLLPSNPIPTAAIIPFPTGFPLRCR